jgi:hypothetical protein
MLERGVERSGRRHSQPPCRLRRENSTSAWKIPTAHTASEKGAPKLNPITTFGKANQEFRELRNQLKYRSETHPLSYSRPLSVPESRRIR